MVVKSIQSVSITNKVVKLYSHMWQEELHVIKFISGLLKIVDFCLFPPPNKLIATFY
jgi:hypothetical protein